MPQSQHVSLIVAVAANGVIGRDGDLPWRLPADLQFFKRVTMGHHVIMGRKTWASIGRALPGRTIVVLTRDPGLRVFPAGVPAGVEVAHDLPQALARAAGDPEVFVAGGAEVYARALPLATRLYLTRVEADVDGDTVFPAFDEQAWVEVARDDHAADERHAFPFAIRTLERRTPLADPGPP